MNLEAFVLVRVSIVIIKYYEQNQLRGKKTIQPAWPNYSPSERKMWARAQSRKRKEKHRS